MTIRVATASFAALVTFTAVAFAATSASAKAPNSPNQGQQVQSKKPLIGHDKITYSPKKTGPIGGNPISWTPKKHLIGGNPIAWTPIRYRHLHRPYIVEQAINTTVVEQPALRAAAVAPTCNCLTKEYLPDGSVMFKDLCTKESAMATPNEMQAQAPGPQAR